MRLPQQRSHSATLVNKKLSVLSNESGVILSIVLSLVLVLAIEFAALAQFASSAMKQVRSQENYTKAFYAAEAVTEKLLASIHWTIENNGSASFSSFTPHLGSDFSGNVNISSVTTATQVLTSGDYKGLTATVQSATVTASVTNSTGYTPATVNISQGIQVQAIPVFQFGAFYQNDLEICPGTTMTFAGRVHTNGDMYLGADSGATMTFGPDGNGDGKLTAFGDVFHGRKSGDDSPGDALGDMYVKDTSGVAQDMKLADSTWLDSLKSTWATDAETKWGGNLEDSSHNVKQLSFPLPVDAQDLQHPEIMIDRRSGTDSTVTQNSKFDYKAHLRIIDGTAMTQAGTTLELRYCSKTGQTNQVYNGTACPSGYSLNNPISTGTFYDAREERTIKSTDIDIAKLQLSPNFASLVSAATTGIIIYHSDHTYDSSSTYQSALRLVNGGTLPTYGMTIATENPLFVKGDYNTISKKKSGLVSDAFNVLSNSWFDSNDASSSSLVGSRVGSNTTVNSAIITGMTETTSTDGYNGGMNCVTRFMEKWTGTTFTYSGSIAVLYDSRRGIGKWNYHKHTANLAYYNAPTRAWSYDTALSSVSVPGFPSVYYVYKVNYEQT